VRARGRDTDPLNTYDSTARLGLPIRGTIRIVSAEPPLRFAYECEDMSGHHLWTMSLRTVGGGSRLTMRVERLAGPLWVRALTAHPHVASGRSSRCSQGACEHQAQRGGEVRPAS
jgi:hypothetical protein